MAIIKEDRKTMDALIDRISKMREARERVREMQKAKETAFWKAIRENLRLTIKATQDTIDRMLDTGGVDCFPELKRLRGIKSEAEEVVFQVEESDKYLDQINSRLSASEAELERIRRENEDA